MLLGYPAPRLFGSMKLDTSQDIRSILESFSHVCPCSHDGQMLPWFLVSGQYVRCLMTVFTWARRIICARRGRTLHDRNFNTLSHCYEKKYLTVPHAERVLISSSRACHRLHSCARQELDTTVLTHIENTLFYIFLSLTPCGYSMSLGRP